jgi:nucleoside-diphosphate-sugar epimerase
MAQAQPKAKAEKRKQAAEQKKRRVALITGATSNLGRRLAERLLSEGWEVRVGIRRQPSEFDFWKKVPAGTIPYVADLTLKKPEDEGLIEQACRGVDVVFHLASITYEHQRSLDDFIELNVIGTENFLNACRKANGTNPIHFIFASSIRVYGKKRPGEVLSEDSELRPVGSYGRSKLMAEQVIRAFAEAQEPKNFSFTVFRMTQMYGPGYEEPYFFRVFRKIKEQKMVYIGNGENHLALVHVDDVVDLFVSAANNPVTFNHTYNLTDGSTYTVRELFTKAANAMGVPPPAKTVNPVIASVATKVAKANTDEIDFLTSDRTVSISRIKKELGYQPKRSVDKEGIEMIYDFLKRYGRKYGKGPACGSGQGGG